MQIKEEHDETSTNASAPTEERDVPIYSSLESLLIIPSSMSRELSEKALRTQLLLDKWSLNRRKMIREMEDIAETLNRWERGCAISTTVGSSVGVASGFAVIGGLVLMPPVAIAGLLVGTAAGVSNVATGLTKMYKWKQLQTRVEEMMKKDERLFDELLKAREDLMEAVRKMMEDEEFYKKFKDDSDFENKLKTVFGASVTGVTGLGAKFAAASMGRLTSSLVKGVLHSVAVIGIVIDSVTLALSVKTLGNGEIPEFSTSLLDASGKMEMMRQKVVKHFLNQDVWNAEDDDQLSDCGSAEMVSPMPSLVPSQRFTVASPTNGQQ